MISVWPMKCVGGIFRHRQAPLYGSGDDLDGVDFVTNSSELYCGTRICWEAARRRWFGAALAEPKPSLPSSERCEAHDESMGCSTDLHRVGIKIFTTSMRPWPHCGHRYSESPVSSSYRSR